MRTATKARESNESKGALRQFPGRAHGAGNVPARGGEHPLRRALGNQAVGGVVQTKLAVGPVDDPYEREADRVAEAVMRMPDPTMVPEARKQTPVDRIQRRRRQCQRRHRQGMPLNCEECEAKLQRKEKDGHQTTLQIGTTGSRHEWDADAAAARLKTDTMPLNPSWSARPRVQRVDQTVATGTEAPAAVHEVLAEPGRPLDSDTRTFMESRLGHDFSAVRVHTDARAAESARAVRARAYTVGRDVVFSAGQYEPANRQGQALLAHELVHVIQQDAGSLLLQRQDFSGCAELLREPSVVSLISGTAVHTAIAEDFAGRVPGAISVGIPGASAAPLRTEGICGAETSMIRPQRGGGRAGMGYPDLARLNQAGVLSVAEIKPAVEVCLVDGENQLTGYIDQGNASDPPQQAWRASLGITVVSPMLSRTYNPPSITTGNVEIRTAWCTPGLMGYTVRQRGLREPVTEPVPVGVRERERERLRDQTREIQPTGPTPSPVPAFRPQIPRATWRHFWTVVITTYAVAGAAAVAMSAADGPLPFGELLSLGLSLAVIGLIVANWDDHWREAERLAQQEA